MVEWKYSELIKDCKEFGIKLLHAYTLPKNVEHVIFADKRPRSCSICREEKEKCIIINTNSGITPGITICNSCLYDLQLEASKE